MERPGIGPLLKEWRQQRGKSQLALSLEAEVSARHLSFLESGRAKPSLDMVLRLAEVLGLPLRDRNALLLSAGYAPEFGESAWESDTMAEVRRAAQLMLASHEPNPALVLDASYVVLDANQGALALIGGTREVLGNINLIDLVFAPGPVREAIGNWPQVATYLLSRLRESVRLRGPGSPAAQLLTRTLQHPGVDALAAGHMSGSGVLVPLVFGHGAAERRWFTTVTTFGAPQEVLAEEIVVELFHPQ